LIYNGVSEIPMEDILKRWTQEAKDFAYHDICADTNDVNALDVVGRAKNDRKPHNIVAWHLKSAMLQVERLVD
jgi:hypothetical protein